MKRWNNAGLFHEFVRLWLHGRAWFTMPKPIIAAIWFSYAQVDLIYSFCRSWVFKQWRPISSILRTPLPVSCFQISDRKFVIRFIIFGFVSGGYNQRNENRYFFGSWILLACVSKLLLQMRRQRPLVGWLRHICSI